jgi:hypothetical protein
MQSKHRREEAFSSATHHHISARVFILTARCGVLTSVFNQRCGYCWGKSVSEHSMNIQCMKQQMRSYIPRWQKECNKIVAAVNIIIWRIKISLSTCIHESLGDTKCGMSTYRMMQKMNFVQYQKLYILKNILVVVELVHLSRQ